MVWRNQSVVSGTAVDLQVPEKPWKCFGMNAPSTQSVSEGDAWLSTSAHGRSSRAMPEVSGLDLREPRSSTGAFGLVHEQLGRALQGGNNAAGSAARINPTGSLKRSMMISVRKRTIERSSSMPRLFCTGNGLVDLCRNRTDRLWVWPIPFSLLSFSKQSGVW